MLKSGVAGSVIVTTVSEVLTTADKGRASLTSAFQPVGSSRSEVSPSIMSWRIPSNANPADGEALALALGDPEGEADGDADGLPPGLGDDDGLALGLPDADAEGDADGLPDALAEGEADGLADGLVAASCVTVTVGEATMALDPSIAVEGTVTVRIS